MEEAERRRREERPNLAKARLRVGFRFNQGAVVLVGIQQTYKALLRL